MPCHTESVLRVQDYGRLIEIFTVAVDAVSRPHELEIWRTCIASPGVVPMKWTFAIPDHRTSLLLLQDIPGACQRLDALRREYLRE